MSAVTGWDVKYCIIAMGVLSTIYTVLGGIEAVIWTDVIQTIVLIGGALIAFFIIVGEVDCISLVATEGNLKFDNPFLRLIQPMLGLSLIHI